MGDTIQRITILMKEKGLKDKDICEYAGINQSTFATWKQKNRDPKPEYLPDIAEFLNVSEKYLLTGEEMTDTEIVAEKLHREPGLRMLFDAADGASPEDLELAAEMLRKMKRNSGYED